MILFSSKPSYIPDKSKWGNGYFFCWSSFNLWHFFVVSLENEVFFPCGLDFSEIFTGF